MGPTCIHSNTQQVSKFSSISLYLWPFSRYRHTSGSLRRCTWPLKIKIIGRKWVPLFYWKTTLVGPRIFIRFALSLTVIRLSSPYILFQISRDLGNRINGRKSSPLSPSNTQAGSQIFRPFLHAIIILPLFEICANIPHFEGPRDNSLHW